MQNEDHRDVDRRPGKIEDRMDAHSGDELAEGVEITQQLTARPTETRRAIDDCRHDSSSDLLVETDAGARQHAGAYRVEPGQRQEGHQQGNGQHHQRNLAGARDYPVIDLQHVQRAGQIKQIDRQAEHRRGDEITLAGSKQKPEFVSSLERSTHMIWRKPPPLNNNVPPYAFGKTTIEPSQI